MKKLLSILALLLIAAFCFPLNGAASGPGDPAFPVGPTGKDIIQNPNTFCNPIAVTSGTGAQTRAGEPIIRVFDGGPDVEDYYILVISSAMWVSDDFVNWTRVTTPAGSTGLLGGIAGLVEIDGKLYNYAGNRENRIRYTNDPKSGIWYNCGTFTGTHSNTFGDASMLYDEETGRLFMFSGLSPMFGTRVYEYDVESFTDPTRNAVQIGEPVMIHWANHHNFGWEIKRIEDYVYPYFRDRDSLVKEYPWTEGPHPLKYKGKYYLMYASNGIEQFSYSHGIYVADDPMGPWTYNQNNPLTRQITGIARGAGHGAIFVDKQDKVWNVSMQPSPLNGGSGTVPFVIYPCEVDDDGMLYADVSYGDHPQYLPGKNPNPSNDNTDQYTGWAILSLNKEVEVSSEYSAAYRKEFGVNEEPMSYWSAATGNAGEYMTVDLGAASDIRGIQTLFDRTGGSARTPNYTIEVSNDNLAWDLIIDKSNNTQDLRSDYIELPTPVTGRYVKLTNKSAISGSRFAVKALRVFGNPDTATYVKVAPANVKIVRSELDRMDAHLLWEPVPGADMYVVRYGIAPDKLHNSYKVFEGTYVNIRALGVEPDYYFEVEALVSGNPLYRGGREAGAELVTDPAVKGAYDKKWVLLSLDKEVEASSIYDTRVQNTQHPIVNNAGNFRDYWPAYAVDEDPNDPTIFYEQNSYWSAVTGDAGEYITVDLGTVSDIRGIQTQWNRAGAFGYTVKVSDDNQSWTQIIDQSANTQASLSNYIELATPAKGRYVKLTNAVPTPDGQRFAVTALRVFGNPDKATFTQVNDVKVVRSEFNPHYAHLLWDEVAGADGYVVRYGTNAANLDKSYMVFWHSYLDIPSLAAGQDYYFEVEAFSSGTPRWVENTYETRGRGANFEFNIPGLSQKRFNYIYETFGRDEVYTIDTNLTVAGQYTVHEGNIFWQRNLTVADLVGPDTGEPSIVDLNCMEFGSGTTQWGNTEVRVYPGPTGGRIEVTLRYANIISITGPKSVVSGAGATATYTVSANGMPQTSGIELEIEVDGSFLHSKEFSFADGWTALSVGNYGTPLFWTNSGNVWIGKAVLYNPEAPSGDFDIMNLTFNVEEGKLGLTDVKLDNVKISYAGEPIDFLYASNKVTTELIQWYSRYDVNKDGVIDLNDLTYALQFLGVSSGDPEWEQAEVCNVNDVDDEIDINDLILILTNYTIPYYS